MNANCNALKAYRPTRRDFLCGLGAGAVVAGASGLAPRLARAASSSHFTRLFPHLPPFAESSPALIAALLDIGKPGGIMDANDNLAAGPIALITDPSLSLNNPTPCCPMARPARPSWGNSSTTT